MAAKLKKRALAEYSDMSSTVVADKSASEQDKMKPIKRLRLVLGRSLSMAQGGRDEATAVENRLKVDTEKDPRDVTAQVAQLLPRVQQLSNAQLRACASKLLRAACDRHELPPEVRTQLLRALSFCLSQESARAAAEGDDEEAEEWEELRAEVRRRVEAWASLPAMPKKMAAGVMSFVAGLPGLGIKLPLETHRLLLTSAEALLKGTGSGSVAAQIGALKMLGECLVESGDKDVIKRILTLAGKTTDSPEPRVRAHAFEALLGLAKHGLKLNVELYRSFCTALSDDFVGVRMAALRLVHALGTAYPEVRVNVDGSGALSREGSPKGKGGRSREDNSVRMVDDAFGKICNAVNDLEVTVRELSAQIIGGFSESTLSQEFLEQTLDKKLMSNMRAKRSAHQRQNKLVSSGEWSSGKKWADDAPKEEIEAAAVNLMSFGACGAFIHGLEDEFLAVRCASVDSLTRLSTRNPRLAAMALDFLVDMFNDEIELVRLKAIESLTVIAGHISLQVHQLEIILAALDDYSLVVREKLHVMLQASTIATKDGLQNVINKLLDNIKKYPADKRSILKTFQSLGGNHSELTLPLVTQLLEVHPFFDTAEPDIEEPGYLCVLVLVFNAARHCPTMEPLLDQHTKKHFLYLLDTYPHLMPTAKKGEKVEEVSCQASTAPRFLQQTLRRVTDSEHLSMANRVQLLERSIEDLRRLGSLEPSVEGATRFAEAYVRAQTLVLRCLQTRFWSGGHARAGQASEVLERRLARAWELCTEMHFMYSGVGEKEARQVSMLQAQLLGLQLLYIVRVSNKSALPVTEQFLSQVSTLLAVPDVEQRISESPFLSALVKKLTEADDHKPGTLARIVQPILLAHPPESLIGGFGASLTQEPTGSISRGSAVIFEPLGMNETPLKYTAGMVLAVPVDCELSNISDISLIRLAIKTPDQRVQLITPKQSHFFAKDAARGQYRLLTDALMSQTHVWSEALHVEIIVVLDLAGGRARKGAHAQFTGKATSTTLELCDPVKVCVLPKAIKRGI